MHDIGPPLAALLAHIGSGDDPALWRLAAEKSLAQAAGLFGGVDPSPRRVLVIFAAIPRRHPETHPDDGALWRRAFAVARDADGWSDEGAAPRLRRRHGHFSLTVCVPTGSRRLAAAEVTCLWRPRFPWAPVEQTEIGREVRVFLRDAAGAWAARGVHG